MSRRVRLDDFNDIPDMTIMPEDVYGANGEPSSWLPQDLAELEDKPPVKPELGGIGIVYPGKRHVFSGPQESAKTLAAYAIVIETVRTGATAIIIDFEMGRWDARDRLVDLGATTDDLHHIHYIEPAEPATEHKITLLVDLQPMLVVIDAAAGAYDIQGLDDNKRTDVERFTRIYVRQFWQADIATIVLDHVVKNLDNRGNYAIGSERKVGGTDVHLGFHPVTPIKRGGTGLYKITTHKDRGGYLQRGRLADLELTSDPATHAISWEFKRFEHTDEPFRPTVLMHHVSLWLQTQDEPATFTTIRANVQGEDKFIGIATERLIEEGYATESAGPRNARLVSHTALYIDQPAPLRPTVHAESPTENSVTNAKTADLTPADPCVTPARRAGVTPAFPTRDAGDAAVERSTTPAPQINVYDPAVQALLDDPDGYDQDIPF